MGRVHLGIFSKSHFVRTLDTAWDYLCVRTSWIFSKSHFVRTLDTAWDYLCVRTSSLTSTFAASQSLSCAKDSGCYPHFRSGMDHGKV
ncbi:hypothetical protein EMCRGX_G032001 [Ephydatia muelleri]